MKTLIHFTGEGKNFIAIKVRKGAERFRLEEFYNGLNVHKTVGHYFYKESQIRFEVDGSLSLYIIGFATAEQKTKIKEAGVLFSDEVSEGPDFAKWQKFEEVYKKGVNDTQTPEELTTANAAFAESKKHCSEMNLEALDWYSVLKQRKKICKK